MVRFLGLILLAAPHAHACSACFSEIEGDQPAAIRLAVLVLLTPTLGVLAAIAVFAMVLWRRSAVSDHDEGDEHDA